MKKSLILILSIIFSHLAGLIGMLFTRTSVETWYQTLEKPFFNPPGWLFGPAWLTLYTLIGIALYLVVIKGLKKQEVKIALVFFGMQWVLNALWSIIFFGLKNPLTAFIEIVFLYVLIILTTITFWKLNKIAGILMIPYILWVTFAMILNFAIFYLN